MSRSLSKVAVLVLGSLGSAGLIVGATLTEQRPAPGRPVATATEPHNSGGQGGSSPDLPISPIPTASLPAVTQSRTDTPIARPAAPSFDVVSVEPTGESVIAGHAAPGATVNMLRDGTRYASIVADGSGQYALLPPPLPPGPHEIALEVTAPDGTKVRSRDSVVIVIDEHKRARAFVALTSPDKVAELLSSARLRSDTVGMSHTLPTSPPSETQGGTKMATAAPRQQELGEIDRAETRAQGDFVMMGATDTGDEAKAGSQTGSVLARQLSTSLVSRGENLWRISKRIYGSGRRYMVIYDANQQQIRNPNLIYPRQVLVLPAQDELPR
jgi:nucleoid-associated protein YgaU